MRIEIKPSRKEVCEMTTRIMPEEYVELESPFAEFFRTLSGPWPVVEGGLSVT